jgi:mannose-6-phosphate isomerase-like protein (cupin superfamily)
MAASEDGQDTSKFRIFRAKDAPGLMEAGCMAVQPFTPVQRAGMDKAREAGYLEGDQIKVLTQLPGFGLTHVWFKEGYALPLHSHNADCMYYVIAGSLRLGTEELGPRDSFFVPSDVPYTYKVGPGGVELLEIRHDTKFDFVNHAHGEAWWNRAAEQTAAHREAWKTATPPKLNT